VLNLGVGRLKFNESRRGKKGRGKWEEEKGEIMRLARGRRIALV